ncbi:MAG: hypothetical protein P8Y23_12035 [Candidatus Lokiarchaeota archaeon]
MLLNREYNDYVATGKSNYNLKWAGLNLNNLSESIIEVCKRDALSKLPHFTPEIIKIVQPILKNSKDFNRKTCIDDFL